jgi:hypothetical protein
MFKKLGVLGLMLAGLTMLAPATVQAGEYEHHHHHHYRHYRGGYYDRWGYWHPYRY